MKASAPLLLAAALLAACAPQDPAPMDAPKADLPFAQGRTFATLDEYLAYLEQEGARDIPWWREVEPGVYELQGRMLPEHRQRLTRKQLAEKFGFRE